MDLTPQIFSAFKPFIFFIIGISILKALITSAWFKGKLGEFIVNLSIKLSLNKDEYHLIKDVTLATADGTTQIDHILISTYGVFVIETKNMKGWIFGSPNQGQWTQTIYKNKYKFQNPIHQNFKHVKTLQTITNQEEIHNFTDEIFKSTIIFIGSSTFKTPMPANVHQGFSFISYIKSFKTKIIDEDQVSYIIKLIEENRFKRSIKTNRDHIKHVKQLKKINDSIR